MEQRLITLDVFLGPYLVLVKHLSAYEYSVGDMPIIFMQHQLQDKSVANLIFFIFHEVDIVAKALTRNQKQIGSLSFMVDVILALQCFLLHACRVVTGCGIN